MKRAALFPALAILLLLVSVDLCQAQSNDAAATLDGGGTTLLNSLIQLADTRNRPGDGLQAGS